MPIRITDRGPDKTVFQTDPKFTDAGRYGADMKIIDFIIRPAGQKSQRDGCGQEQADADNTDFLFFRNRFG